MCCEGRGQGEGRMTGWQRDRVTRGHWDKETTGMRVRPCEGTLTMRHERRWCQIISPCLRHECLSCGRGHGAIAPGEVEKEAANANTWVRWEETFVRYKKITECRRGDGATKRPCDKEQRDCMVLYAMPLAWMPLLLESPRCNSTGWGRNESGKCEYMSKIRKDIPSL
jgi:hypothetical protein